MVNRPSAEDRLRVLGFPEPVVQEFVREVPTLKWVTWITLPLTLFILLVTSVLWVVSSGAMYIVAMLVCGDAVQGCLEITVAHIEQTAEIRWIASMSTVVLLLSLILPRAPRTFRMGMHFTSFF